MHALYIIEFAFAALFAYAVITQLVLPLLRDTPIFPWLELERKLTNKLHDAKQGVVEAELERDIYHTNEVRKAVKSFTKTKGR